MKFTTRPQAQTLQQKMGWMDTDLTTPGHDAIMMVLNEQTTSAQLEKWRGRSGWIPSDIDESKMHKCLQVTKIQPMPDRLDWPGFDLIWQEWEMPGAEDLECRTCREILAEASENAKLISMELT
jgi:hypothetical protein